MSNGLVNRLLATDAGWGPLALRLPVGIIFTAHGAQKLFGWFGGYGLEGTGKWMASIGLEPGYLMALLGGGAEFFGGLALIIGLLVRPASAVLAFAMLVAIFSVHAANGLFMKNNGYEFGLALLAVSISLLFSGAGKASLDAVLAPAGGKR
ncbi:DoxX family membrane protein [Aromatoleum toluvorans]|uniref:DoxX family membrane protein n=1 Tax=Aromatoleum toluvorans TaxID=92002 RepID=A0ABX1PV01_9RHOO|nr:DoxX family protein [Aromatoleum toluvorans]NMG42968.1 DoxX family membrane protein [Aromatoleum toluvorans]